MLGSNIVAILLLDALGDGSGNGSAETGIFGVVFKITAAQRIPVDIQCGSQPVGATIFLHLPENCFTNLLQQLGIPGLSQCIGHGEGSGILVQHSVLLRITCHELLEEIREGIHNRHSKINGPDLAILSQCRTFLDAQTRRTITECHIDQPPIPELGSGITHRTGKIESVIGSKHTDTHHDFHHILH